MTLSAPTFPLDAPRNGGQILVQALLDQGTPRVFCVPGESFLAVLDALHDARDRIDTVVCRQEGGAGFMAEATGKLRGTPGVCFVTRGPGATNAAIALHTARQDSTPMLLFIGQVARDTRGREAWQEMDYRQVFGSVAKWVDEVDDLRRLPELVSRAFHVATAGRPGPVVLSLPEDLLAELEASPGAVARVAPHVPVPAAPAAADLEAIAARLVAARRPLLWLGGGGWDAGACADIARFARRWNLPVISSFRRQDLMDHADPQWCGEAGLGMDPQVAARIGDADLILAVGPRLGETSTRGYELLAIPTPAQALVHVHPDPQEPGRVYRPVQALCAGMGPFAAAAAALVPPFASEDAPWAARTRAARAARDAFHTPGPLPAGTPAEGVDLGAVMRHLREVMPRDTVVSNGAGNYTLWVQRFWPYGGWRTQLAPTSGCMGYGLPAAIAARLDRPRREALCFAGDGCFLMNGQELATAMQVGAGVLVIVVNNGMYGSIRMHQERHHPGKVWATGLHNPDFAALARSHGAHGESVTRTGDFAGALARARGHTAQGRPALIELQVSPEALTPQLSVSALRAAAR